MGREFELKYRCDDQAFEKLLKAYGDFSEIEMETTYYDTPQRILGARHWTLRRRKENGISVCTVKIPAPGGARGEWEIRWSDIKSAVPKLCQLGAPRDLAALTKKGVKPVCGAKFVRRAGNRYQDGSLLEIAIDRGLLLGGDRMLPFCEVEVELKEGKDQDAVLFARVLAEKYGLVPEPRSKYARALALTEGIVP